MNICWGGGGGIHDLILLISKGAHKKANNTIIAYIHVQVNKARGESLFDEFLDSKVKKKKKKSRDGRPRAALTQDWETELAKTLSIWQLPWQKQKREWSHYAAHTSSMSPIHLPRTNPLNSLLVSNLLPIFNLSFTDSYITPFGFVGVCIIIKTVAYYAFQSFKTVLAQREIQSSISV